MPSCPWCLEKIPFRQRKAADCPHCGRSLRVDEKNDVRPIDLRYADTVLRVEENYRRLLMPGLFLILGGLLAVQFFPPLALVVWAANFIAARWLLVRDARRILGKARRFFARWIVRLLFLTLGVSGYGLAAVPFAGPVAGLATYLALNWITKRYVLRCLRRERDRLPLNLAEKAILGLLLFLLLVLLSCLGIGIYYMFWIWNKTAPFWHWLGFKG